MRYIVQTVGEDDLPEGVSRVIVEQEDGPPLLFISGEPAKTWHLMRMFEDACEPCDVPSVLLRAV